MALRLPYAGVTPSAALTEGWDTIEHVSDSMRTREEADMRMFRLRQAEAQRRALARDLEGVQLGDTNDAAPWAHYDPGDTSQPYTGTSQRPVTTASPAPASTEVPSSAPPTPVGPYRVLPHGGRNSGQNRPNINAPDPGNDSGPIGIRVIERDGSRIRVPAVNDTRPEIHKGITEHLNRRGYTPPETSETPAAGAAANTPQTPTITDMHGLLEHIAGLELGSRYGGRYDVLNGGETFDTNGPHPNRVGRGGTTTAAGKYQIIHETWMRAIRALGLPDQMTPENQDLAAAWIASNDYQANTGRNLQTELPNGMSAQQISAALGSTWEGLLNGGGGARTQQASAQTEEYTPHFLDEEVRNIRAGTGLAPTHQESLNRLHYLTTRAQNARTYGDIDGFNAAFTELQAEQVNERQHEARRVIDRFDATGDTHELSQMLAYYWGYSEGKNPSRFTIVPDGNNPDYFVALVDGQPVPNLGVMSREDLVTEALAATNEGFRVQLQEAGVANNAAYSERAIDAMFDIGLEEVRGRNQERVERIRGRYANERQLIQSTADYERARLTAMTSGNRLMTAEGPDGTRLVLEMRGNEPVRVYEIGSEMVDTPEMEGGFFGLGGRRVQRPQTYRREISPADSFEAFDALRRADNG